MRTIIITQDGANCTTITATDEDDQVVRIFDPLADDSQDFYSDPGEFQFTSRLIGDDKEIFAPQFCSLESAWNSLGVHLGIIPPNANSHSSDSDHDARQG